MFDKTLVLDGGLSTALEEAGNSLNTSLWSAELLKSDPEQIRSAHQRFVDAGADVVITSSYQLSFPGCTAAGWSEAEIESALVASTELARFDGVFTAASVGPYGACRADGSEYRGNYGLTKDELKDFHRKRLQILIESKPDLLAIETIPEKTEAVALLELLEELHCDIPGWISFSCSNATQISSGENFRDVVQLLKDSESALTIGINCTAPEHISELLEQTGGSDSVVYPNLGRSWNAQTKEWSPAEDSELSAFEVERWKALGARVIGGCCGVGPDAIAEMKAAIGKR